MPLRPENEKVRVVCRCRPENQKEVESGGTSCVRFFPNDKSVIEVNLDDIVSTFSLDRMFNPESTTQQAVFEDAAMPLVADVLQGYNATIFAYGQTGTGKVCVLICVRVEHCLRRQGYTD
jgi:Kinesin motor domain